MRNDIRSTIVAVTICVVVGLLVGGPLVLGRFGKFSKPPKPTVVPSSPGGGTTLGELTTALMGARDVEEKHDIVIGHVRQCSPMFASKPDLTMEEQVKEHVLQTTAMGQLLQDTYPEVIRSIVIEPRDLSTLADRFSSPYWDFVHPGGPPKKVSEQARGWLFLLTGQVFADRAEFQRWQESHPQARRNAETGRFE